METHNRTYEYYRDIFADKQMPYAFVDLDLFDENIRQIAPRAGNKKIRVASKSLRVASLFQRIFDVNPVYQGLMTYSLNEAVWLSQKGYDDILMGYPSWNEEQVAAAIQELNNGKSIILMIDLPEHVEHLNRIGQKYETVIPVCIDLDMSSDYPGIHFGVYRSSITNKEQALALWKTMEQAKYVRLDALMGYEAQIAGLGDNWPGKFLMNNVVKFLKSRSTKEIAKRRADVVNALTRAGANIKIVNGGGTGSMEWTKQENVVTEITVGSGFFNSKLFDHYTNFRHHPSAAYAIEIVRKPKPNIYTCHGGGYTASGAVGRDKEPEPYLPAGARLIPNEGGGEVQTPVTYKGPLTLNMGDPVFMRHAKAGELSKHFNTVYLVQNGQIVDEVPTYRGEGQCFL